jgi:hypothetical protein
MVPCWGWLIDPYQRQVFVYRAGQEPERVTGPKITGEGPVEGFELDLARVWRCYKKWPDLTDSCFLLDKDGPLYGS